MADVSALLASLDSFRDGAACSRDRCSIPRSEWLPSDEHVCGRRCEAECGISSIPPPSPRAQRTCAGCPVVVRCVDHAVRFDEYGLWGIGWAKRRELERLLSVSDHAGIGCGCAYCEKLAEWTHPATIERVANANGAGATCGHIATYSKGCRCGGCTTEMAYKGRVYRLGKLPPVDYEPSPLPALPVPVCEHAVGRCRSCEAETLYDSLAVFGEPVAA